MSVKCKILLVLLNLFCSNGDTDEELVFTGDWTTRSAETLTGNPAQQLPLQNLQIQVKKIEKSSTRYWKEPSSTNKVGIVKIVKATAKKKKIATSKKITTIPKKKKTTTANTTKIMTKKKTKTANTTKITRKKKTTTANITKILRKKKTTSPNTKITTTKKIKTVTPHEIASTTTKNITSPNEIINEKTTLSTTKTEVSSSRQDIIISTELKSNESEIVKNTSIVTTTNKITTISTKNKNNNATISTKNKKKKSNTTKKVVKNNMQAADNPVNKPILNPYDIKNVLLKVMSSFPNANATAEVIGRSVEYKDIVLLKITDANTADKKIAREDKTNVEEEIKSDEKIGTEMNTDGKKIIFIVHGLSTFELWKIPCLYEEMQLKLLISFYLSHLKNFDIFLIPVANPDGFARKDNLWNKNVSPQEDCGGVALDRNFDVAWNSRSNVSTCDQLYPGPAPFSEAESEAVKDVFLQYGKKMAAYVHVHATENNFDYRGHTVLIPKGYTDEESDEDKYIDMRGEIDEAIRKSNFDIVSVNVKTVYSWYGPVAGTSVDYASEVIKVPFAMEFLMQPYPTGIRDFKKDLSQAALTHIWKMIIDTVFNFIHEITNSDESD